MKVLFNKVDMDTCLTAFVLGVSENDQLVFIRGDASPEVLADPGVLCIEVGGSGQTMLSNFDHHDPGGPSAPACEQALAVKGGEDVVKRLVEYVATVDSRGGPDRFEKTEPPCLSNVFSGMLLCTPDPVQQLLEGMEIFDTVTREMIDPFGTMPRQGHWQQYIKAYESNARRADSVRAIVRSFATKSGLKGGSVETDYIGAPGLIYGLGCDIAVVCHPHYGAPPVCKFTIAGRDIGLEHVKSVLNALEPGWGGPSTGTIIGSPRAGSSLTLQEVVNIVAENV